MEFDPKRSARVDVKRRRQREDAKVDKRTIRDQEWDNDSDKNNILKKNQKLPSDY